MKEDEKATPVAATFAEVMNQDKHDEPDCAEIEGVDYGNGNTDAS